MRPHLPVLAGVALALAGTAPAAAAPVPIYGGHTSQDAPIALRATADGRKLTQMLVYVDLKCDDGTGESWFGPASFAAFKPPTIDAGTNVLSPARVDRHGSFRATGEEPFQGAKLTETLRGSLRRGVAHGTYSAVLEMTDDTTGAKVTCSSGTVRWAARSAPGRVYAGLTSDGGPVVIQRSRDGRQVDTMWLGWQAPCQSGLFFDFGDRFVHFPVSRAGRFGNAFDDPVTLDGGATRTYAYRLSGRLGANRASGSFHVVVTEKDAAGATTDTCDGTQLRWTAISTKGKPPKSRRSEIKRVGA